jgi:hypothetical protein
VVTRRLHSWVCLTHYLCCSHFQGCGICPPYIMPESQVWVGASNWHILAKHMLLCQHGQSGFHMHARVHCTEAVNFIYDFCCPRYIMSHVLSRHTSLIDNTSESCLQAAKSNWEHGLFKSMCAAACAYDVSLAIVLQIWMLSMFQVPYITLVDRIKG